MNHVEKYDSESGIHFAVLHDGANGPSQTSEKILGTFLCNEMQLPIG